VAQLVEGALGGHNAELFGGSADPPGPEAAAAPTPPSVSLLDTNQRFTAGLTTAGGVWSVFHAGAAKAVAAALVEAVCPEAAGAELAWPPEELARATVERDLRILRRFR
ncbi:INT5 protein, partial [Setophaga kirtlandii]|nr:INT5 protein [Setophaga kirtlandii]